MSIDHLGGKEEVLYLDGETGVGGGVANVACSDDVDAEADEVDVQCDDEWEWGAFRRAYTMLERK